MSAPVHSHSVRAELVEAPFFFLAVEKQYDPSTSSGRTVFEEGYF
jgi:hypothetical protein